jgi:hypothetical protein
MSLLHVDLVQSVHEDLRREGNHYRMSHQGTTDRRGWRHRFHLLPKYEPAGESVSARARTARTA